MSTKAKNQTAKKKTKSLFNIYDQFIDYLKKEERSLNLEKHHILPFYDKGRSNEPIVLCSAKNHTLAHYYRYLAYGQRGDFVVFTMRRNQKIEKIERALLAVEKNKQFKNGFWNSEWQALQGKKGGKVSGRKNGLLYRQGTIMRETIKRSTYWEFTYNKKFPFLYVCQNKMFKTPNKFFSIVKKTNTFLIIKIKP